MPINEHDVIRAQNYVKTLHALRERAIEIDYEVRMLILSAREEGVTWEVLGEILGTSRQAAWEKYRPKDLDHISPGQGTLPIDD